MPPPFENFLLDTLKSEKKPSVKIPVDRADQSTGDDFEIYRSGRVEKILTGSISAANPLRLQEDFGECTDTTL